MMLSALQVLASALFVAQTTTRSPSERSLSNLKLRSQVQSDGTFQNQTAAVISGALPDPYIWPNPILLEGISVTLSNYRAPYTPWGTAMEFLSDCRGDFIYKVSHASSLRSKFFSTHAFSVS